jgi:hypothetical protein
MDLIRRTARLERQVRSLAGRRSPPEPEELDMEYNRCLWLAYSRPGDPPPPATPITFAEFYATLDAVYGPEATHTPARRAPPPPPYVLLWQRTGQVTHPLLRYIIAAYTGGKVMADSYWIKPDPPAVEPQSGAPGSDPDDPGPDLPSVGPGALP